MGFWDGFEKRARDEEHSKRKAAVGAGAAGVLGGALGAGVGARIADSVASRYYSKSNDIAFKRRYAGDGISKRVSDKLWKAGDRVGHAGTALGGAGGALLAGGLFYAALRAGQKARGDKPKGSP